MVLGLVSSADGIPGGIPQFRVLPSATRKGQSNYAELHCTGTHSTNSTQNSHDF